MENDRERREPSDAAEPQAEGETPPEAEREEDAAATPPTPWPAEPPAEPEPEPEAWPAAPGSWEADAPDAWPSEPVASSEAPAQAAPTPASEAPVEAAATTPVSETVAPTEHQPPPGEVESYESAGDEALAAAGAGVAAGAAAHTVPDTESATGESTRCPRCGTENRPGLAFCRNCGQRLIAAGVAPTVERPRAPEGTQACPRCGTHNRAGVAFCQNCGANLRAAAAGYVPPAVSPTPSQAAERPSRGPAVLGPVVLLIGVVGIATAYLLPFGYGVGSLYERALGPGGYGFAFWNGYPDVGGALADQAYYGLTGPAPAVGALLVILALAGFVRASPGVLQRLGLAVSLLWSVGVIVLFVIVEIAGSWGGDLIALLRDLTPGGIIFFLASLIVLIGTLTRFARS